MRRHCVLLATCCGLLAALPLMGSTCLGPGGDGTDAGPGGSRADCEALCDVESQCNLGRDKATCIAAICTDTGFKTIDTGADAEDLGTISSTDCEKTAADCGALAKCSCPDACSREATCTGGDNASCVDDCDNLIQTDTSLYLENRCKIESACADLAACGGSSSGQ
jgi:hypothetical protein